MPGKPRTTVSVSSRCVAWFGLADARVQVATAVQAAHAGRDQVLRIADARLSTGVAMPAVCDK